ncbi:MAG: transposase [Candidatus Binatia bacterium]
MKVFVEGLATRAFGLSLRLLMGSHLAPSPSIIGPLAGGLGAEYAAFDQRHLSESTFAWIWADGIYLRTGREWRRLARWC